MSKPTSDLSSIDPIALSTVTGGAARVTARQGAANQELLTMMSSIGDSIKSLAANQSAGGMDPMMMMVMMMMMGGGGGGGAGPSAPPAPPPQPQLPTINVSIRRGC